MAEVPRMGPKTPPYRLLRVVCKSVGMGLLEEPEPQAEGRPILAAVSFPEARSRPGYASGVNCFRS